MSVHIRCIGWGLVGLTLGLASVAHGQDVAPVAVLHATGGASIDDPAVWIELARVLGLPGVLLVLFSRIPRLQLPIALSEEDRKIAAAALSELRRIRRSLENEPVTGSFPRPPSPITRDED